MASSPSADAFISFKGIDPELEATVTEIEKSIVAGKLADLKPRNEDDYDGIVLGQDLAKQLGVTVGDRINLLTPTGTLNPFTGMSPRMRPMRVAGIFRLGPLRGRQHVRARLARCRRAHAEQDAAGNDSAGVRRHLRGAGSRGDAFPQILGDRYVTQDWTTMNRPLFEALFLEKMAVSITIGLIVMVAALNIIASLVLLVMEKTADIAILKTMGATSRSVMYVFMLQGLIIGSIGTAIGAVAGVAISWVMNRYQLLRVPGMGEVYQISYVPFTLRPVRVAGRGRDGRADLFPRHDLSVASGREAEAGRGAAIRLGIGRSTDCSEMGTICAAIRTPPAAVSPYFPRKLVALSLM